MRVIAANIIMRGILCRLPCADALTLSGASLSPYTQYARRCSARRAIAALDALRLAAGTRNYACYHYRGLAILPPHYAPRGVALPYWYMVSRHQYRHSMGRRCAGLATAIATSLPHLPARRASYRMPHFSRSRSAAFLYKIGRSRAGGFRRLASRAAATILRARLFAEQAALFRLGPFTSFFRAAARAISFDYGFAPARHDFDVDARRLPRSRGMALQRRSARYYAELSLPPISSKISFSHAYRDTAAGRPSGFLRLSFRRTLPGRIG